MRFLFTLFVGMLFFTLPSAQANNFWKDVEESTIALPEGAQRNTVPKHYRSLSLEWASMVATLKTAPLEFTQEAKDAPLFLELPLPNGKMELFKIWESPMMEDGLAAAYPEIKTFAGQSVQNPTITTRMDFNPNGFHAIIHTNNGTVLIEPYANLQQSYYTTFYTRNVEVVNDADTPHFGCGVHDSDLLNTKIDLPENLTPPTNNGAGDPVNLHKYRLAVATTSEYSSAHGGTAASVLADVTTVINNVNSVFERDGAVRLVLIDGLDAVFFLTFPDPYTNGNLPEMLGENAVELANAFGTDAFDIGHVFGTNAGGLAQLSSVCTNNKARGASATFGAFSGALFFHIVAHEMGHQFSATHTFNFCDAMNETLATAYEPGSGSTIMSYAGAGNDNCNNGAYWVEPVDDDYFHVNSMVRIQEFSRDMNSGGACAEIVSMGNTTPNVSIPIQGGFNIPISTPFELTGEATDDEGDNLTYCWEQYDLGPMSPLGSPAGSAPSFRSFPPKNTPTRVFPRMNIIVNNDSDIDEVLPTYTRDFTFRMTVRDNNSEGGGFDFAEIGFKATETAGPFLVMQPNTTDVEWVVGDYMEVTWDVANTTGSFVNCQEVKIRLSLDGGFTYPITLLENTPNDGSEFVVVPDEVSSTARVRVEGVGNIFFDISNADFNIIPPSDPSFLFQVGPTLGEICLPEPISIEIETASILGFEEAIEFSVNGLPAGAVPTFSSNNTMPGESVTLTIDLTDVTVDELLTFEIQASAAGIDPQIRPVTYNIVYSDFSALELIEPIDGATGIASTNFSWTDLPNANTYDIELATSPAFGVGDIVDSGTGLSDPAFSPAIALDESTAYYWRIRPHNECGTGEFSSISSFFTVALGCSTVTSADIPKNIPAQGLPTILSVLNIPTSGVISDINVVGLKGNHDSVGDLEFRLKSPEGTPVVLLSEPLCFVPQFDMGLDDEAPLDPPCPPIGGTFKPDGFLSDFDDEDVQGNWTLEVIVKNELGNGGTLEGWGIEFCGGFEASNPFVSTNAGMCIEPGGDRRVRKDDLEVKDDDNPSVDLEYTLVTNVLYGTLKRNGVLLNIGDTFTQSDINSNRIRYENTDVTAITDFFTFTVVDGNGGFLGTTQFSIEIIEFDCATSTTDVDIENSVVLYPNPATDVVNVEFKKAISGNLTAQIIDVQGRQLGLFEFENVNGKIELNTKNLSSGVYLINLQTKDYVLTKKLTIQ